MFKQQNSGPITLSRATNPEGYVAPTFSEGADGIDASVRHGMSFCYYIKDHLGNIHEVYSSCKETIVDFTELDKDDQPMVVDQYYTPLTCIQRMQYYPSGLPWKDCYRADEQTIKYNSKEFVEMHGLDEYDFQARWYYPAIMRTTTMDPLCEKYYSTSPYAWCGNNPINYVDPQGARPLPMESTYKGWIARVDSWFGPRNTGEKGASTNHKGLDFNYSCGGDGDYGTPILATHEGFVHVVDNIDSKAGRYVEITSEDGSVRTRYLHLSAISITEGQYVLESEKIGEMGGSASGNEHKWKSHLHYEIQKIINGKWISIDPVEGKSKNINNILDPQSIIDVDNNLYWGCELPEIEVFKPSKL